MSSVQLILLTRLQLYLNMSICRILFLLSIITVSTVQKVWAQSIEEDSDSFSLKGWTLSPLFSHGKIWKHTPKFQPEILRPSNTFEINIAKHTRGTRGWQQLYHYPSFGLAIGFTNFGNDAILGHAIYFLPSIDIPLATYKDLSLRFRVGSGVALLSRHYDYVSNPTNNVIASALNNITSFSSSLNWHLADHLVFFGGGSFTHFSTGAVRTPNLGINIPAWNVGVRYQPVPYKKDEFVKTELTQVTRKLLFNIVSGIGFQEQLPAHGPMYHVFFAELSTGMMITRWDKLSLGMMGTYKEAAHTFIILGELYADQLFLHSCAFSGLLRNDFIFGMVGISAVLGYNFYEPSPLEYSFYQRIGIPVYLPAFGKEKNDKFSIGVFVTAGDFTADFVSVDCGFQF